jgi:hypothetical protein
VEQLLTKTSQKYVWERRDANSGGSKWHKGFIKRMSNQLEVGSRFNVTGHTNRLSLSTLSEVKED